MGDLAGGSDLGGLLKTMGILPTNIIPVCRKRSKTCESLFKEGGVIFKQQFIPVVSWLVAWPPKNLR